ncbi:maleylpyruvate isomerase N-terminal domain-containing protein [Glutamicibacter sp. JC586]|uniref:maleylpyruvate isomerase N-terminal domain-containing protein n=1 Tax=Glutamicibacter sp. JC586 TaxID=2590552 RepID=UPI00135B7F23|nr:maleylpyruvate isomerase N-terminal domain-containing protein [Glutamicibacter sp. JC586]
MDLEKNPSLAAQLCLESHKELLEHLAGLSDVSMQRDSKLPGWSVGHVLTHLARNADAHARRLEGALNGEDLPKYANGAEQRRQEIEDGARNSASEILADLEVSIHRLDRLLEQSEQAEWPNADFMGGGHYGVGGCPAHRLREVQMHLVDLGLGYSPSQWPDEYAAWDLGNLLATVPERLASVEARTELIAWLAGRGPLSKGFTLDPWG